jgi:hypothetical protein
VVILRTFLALAAGLSVAVLIALALSAWVARLFPNWTEADSKLRKQAGDLYTPKRKAGFVFVSLGSSFLSAAAGGYITGWIATVNPLIHVLVLGLVVLMLAALNALQERGRHPIWLQLTLVAIAPLGVLAGGLARLKVLGFL